MVLLLDVIVLGESRYSPMLVEQVQGESPDRSEGPDTLPQELELRKDFAIARWPVTSRLLYAKNEETFARLAPSATARA